MNIHEKYIKRCIELAKNGLGTTYPNPMVGSVIVLNDVIIGEGWHKKAGEPHAEVNAINSVEDKSLLKKATIYVSLEPCSHYGNTPPCANLIIESGIKHVVMGVLDSNSKVCGRGMMHLQQNGCDVTIGVLEKECSNLNKRFFTFHKKKRPFIVLKWAETNNGFIAPVYPELVSGTNKKMLKQVQHKSPIWISNQYSQQLVHQWRSEEHAILVGTNTVIADNPKLNLRSWSGNNPIRIVMDRNLRIPNNASVFDGSVKTIVLIEKREEGKEESVNIVFEEIDFTKNIAKQICDVLHKHQIQSVIIEGGTQTLQTFIDENLWDEARVFIGENEFEKGVKSPGIKGTLIEEINIKKDVLKIYRND